MNRLLISILIVSALLRACTLSESDTYKHSKPDTPERLEMTADVPVTIVKARKDSLIQYYVTTGTIKPLHSLDVPARVNSSVNKIYMQNGSQVAAGDPLIELEKDRFLDELIQTRSKFIEALDAALQELRIIRTPNYHSMDTYLKTVFQSDTIPILPGFVPTGVMDEVLLTKREYMILTRHEVPTKYVQVRRTETQIGHCTIYAPFSGHISDLSVSPGSIVHPNSRLFNLTSLDTVQLTIDLLEDEISLITPGTLFRIPATDYYPSFRGEIRGIAPGIDEKTHTGKAFAILPNQSHRWMSGQFVSVEVQKAALPDQIVIPREAILNRNDRDLVFIVKNGKAKWRYVTLGRQNNRWIALSHGVAPGDTVIVSGHYSLAHDSPVDPRFADAISTD